MQGTTILQLRKLNYIISKSGVNEVQAKSGQLWLERGCELPDVNESEQGQPHAI